VQFGQRLPGLMRKPPAGKGHLQVGIV
jgi:hypothetical protein